MSDKITIAVMVWSAPEAIRRTTEYTINIGSTALQASKMAERIGKDIAEQVQELRKFGVTYPEEKTMKDSITVPQSEIDDLLNECDQSEETGTSRYPGMSYEQGIKAALMWVTGNSVDHPFE